MVNDKDTLFNYSTGLASPQGNYPEAILKAPFGFGRIRQDQHNL